MHTITLAELQRHEGGRIDTIGDCAYHNNAEDHGARLVSHALGASFGFTCKGMTGRGTTGANIRVHEVVPRRGRVGPRSDRPEHLTVCLAFVTAVGNVKLPSKRASNVPV